MSVKMYNMHLKSEIKSVKMVFIRNLIIFSLIFNNLSPVVENTPYYKRLLKFSNNWPDG